MPKRRKGHVSGGRAAWGSAEFVYWQKERRESLAQGMCCGLCTKNTARQGGQVGANLELDDLNTFGVPWAIEVVSSCQVSGPGVI